MDKEKVKELLREIKSQSFTADYINKATDEEAMGLLISKYFEWDGISITKSFMEALEDSNFHGEVALIEKEILAPLLK